MENTPNTVTAEPSYRDQCLELVVTTFGVVYGAAYGSVVPGAGTLIGALVGFIGGAAAPARKVKKTK